MSSLAIDIDSIKAAQARIRPHVVATPVLTNDMLDACARGRVFIKAESLQRTGSFKFRGAINRLLALSERERERGVVAFSSGNHALAVAEAAKLLGCTAVLVMPKDAPAVKISGVKSRGAEVVLYDRQSDDRAAIVADVVKNRGLIFVSPFDDPLVIAGQGTGAAEAVQQLGEDFDVSKIDQALVCCSGGGLAAGWGTALKGADQRTQLITVEPVGFDDMARSLATGRWEANDPAAQSICDALQVASPGKLTLPLLINQKARGVTVSDREVCVAMQFAVSELKLVLEPGGAAALAAVLARKVETDNRTTLLVVSGGNVDPMSLWDAFNQNV